MNTEEINESDTARGGGGGGGGGGVCALDARSCEIIQKKTCRALNEREKRAKDPEEGGKKNREDTKRRRAAAALLEGM